MRTGTRLLASLGLTVVMTATYAQPIPKFEECPAKLQVKHGTPHVTFADARARQYQTVIRNAAKDPIDFAGHYILASWGCGSGCVMAAAIDAKSGRVTSLPFSVSGWPLDITEPLSYRANSCLLIVRGTRNESSEHGTYYYTFDGAAFKLRASEVDRQS